MYLPPQFNTNDPETAARIMRAHPFASLISNDDDGFPFVTHLPLHLQQQSRQPELPHVFRLLGHCAKPNPHWRYLQARPKALVTFVGPHAYMSPSVYPDRARVPTWNYLAVHCQVQARLIEEPAAKDQLLKHLIGDHEPDYAAQWRSLGEDFAHKMLAGIVAFELDVLDWQCKIKINQHRPEAHAAMYAQYAGGGPGERALAGWMRDSGLKVEAS